MRMSVPYQNAAQAVLEVARLIDGRVLMDDGEGIPMAVVTQAIAAERGNAFGGERACLAEHLVVEAYRAHAPH